MFQHYYNHKLFNGCVGWHYWIRQCIACKIYYTHIASYTCYWHDLCYVLPWTNTFSRPCLKSFTKKCHFINYCFHLNSISYNGYQRGQWECGGKEHYKPELYKNFVVVINQDIRAFIINKLFLDKHLLLLFNRILRFTFKTI